MALFVSAIFHEKIPMVWHEWNVINNCVMQEIFFGSDTAIDTYGYFFYPQRKKQQESTRKSPNAFRGNQKKQKNASAQYKRHTLFCNSMFAASCDENYTVNYLHQLTKPLTATSTGVALDNSTWQSGETWGWISLYQCKYFWRSTLSQQEENLKITQCITCMWQCMGVSMHKE